ncbi:cytochrome P450 315a1, mitochondrial-like [Limulus polyphemus]|uniref:Cytochrome P450 315a1, mitochondrial-like n=1 Tax=Limulus polyphemus TaxID=6850 RepID=A0ABM1B6G5_LIMPO|nr:cytochrome P450 315a1, mitochondrial-like [Limulus polyphemus]
MAPCPAKAPFLNSVTSGKPYEHIPSPKGLPLVGTMFDLLCSGGAPKIHEYCDKRHKELGSIYREKLGAVEAVFVAEGELIQRVYQNEGRYPMHLVPEPWLIYNEINGIRRGLFFMDGPQWSERRKSLNKVFRQQSVSDHARVFNEVINDLLDRWRKVRGEDMELENLERELYNWSIDSLGTMIFGRRLGCVTSDSKIGNIHEFVHCVQQIFTESAHMTMIPPRLAYWLKLPVWRRFVQAADRALGLAKAYVEDNVKDIFSKAETGEPVEGVLSQMLLEDKIEQEEIVRIVTDLFLAAADTWKYTPVRLFPVAPFLTRILSQDIILNGYKVPAGKLILMSLYTTGRDPTFFPEPGNFKPDRWLRNRYSRDVINTFACLPFGFGTRSCIGRRVAEMQMQFLLARVIQNFHLVSANKKDVGIIMRMITTPNEPIKLRLRDRSK